MNRGEELRVGRRLARADGRLDESRDYVRDVRTIVRRSGVAAELVEKVLGELGTWDVAATRYVERTAARRASTSREAER